MEYANHFELLRIVFIIYAWNGTCERFNGKTRRY